MAQCECLKKVRDELMAQDENHEYIIIELSNIKNMSRPELGYKTGQRLEVKYKDKKKLHKTFISHDYCPFCGVKYEPDEIEESISNLSQQGEQC